MRIYAEGRYWVPQEELEAVQFAAGCTRGQRTTQFCALLEDAVAQAYERAAKVCDRERYEGYVPPEDGGAAEYYNDAARNCAAAIRALSSKNS